MKMVKMLKTWMPFIVCFMWGALLVCNAQHALTVNAVVGQDVTIPCGVQRKGPFGRLVWKTVAVNNSEDFAYSYQGSVSCDTTKKDCLLTQDGSLVLRNVEETTAEDYFCTLDNEMYYSQHTLIVHPEAAFECLDSASVSVFQTGPQEMVLAYTSPVCSNKHEIGNVTCDPPSGAKIGISVTEIVCQCTHSGSLLDTCEIPIPDLPLGFENCPASDSVLTSPHGESSQVVSYETPVCRNAKNVVGLVSCEPPSGTSTDGEEIVCTCHHGGNIVDRCEIQIPAAVACSQVTLLWILVGILIIALVITYIALAVWCFKYRSGPSSNNTGRTDDTQMNDRSRKPEGYREVDQSDQGEEQLNQDESQVHGTPEKSSQQNHEVVSKNDSTPDPGKTQGGNPIASVTESDGDMQTENDSKQSFNEMKEIFVVNGEMPKFKILPCRQKPSDGIEIRCKFCGNLHVNVCHRDGDPSPDIQFDFKTSGLSVNMTKLITLPVHITCDNCGENCCLLEIYGDKWIG